MNDWQGLRIVALIAIWLTVGGGVVLATVWFKAGGARAAGPEDQIMSEAGAAVRSENGKTTSFSTAQVLGHALLALLTASLITYAVLRPDNRGGGYLVAICAIAVTAVPGVMMYWKWRTGIRPQFRTADVASAERVEDHLPKPVVVGHGLLAATVVTLLIALVILD